MRCYHQEAKWSYSRYVPLFNEYLRNGFATSAYGLFPTASLIGMKSAEIKEFEWMQSNPQIAKSTKMLGRLENDIVTHEVPPK